MKCRILYLFYLLTAVGFPEAAKAQLPSVRVVAVELENGISNTTKLVDALQGVCEEDDRVTDEPFTDDFMRLTIQNSSSSLVAVQHVSFVIRKNTKNDRRLRSRRLVPSGNLFIPSGEEATLSTLFLDAHNGAKTLGGRVDQTVPSNGFRRVRVILLFRDSFGRLFRRRAGTTVSFADINACEAN